MYDSRRQRSWSVFLSRSVRTKPATGVLTLVVLAFSAVTATGAEGVTPQARPQASSPLIPVLVQMQPLPAVGFVLFRSIPSDLPAPPVRFRFTIDPKTPFTIDPKTPLKDLLPVPPPDKKLTGPVLTEDLTKVPEVELQAPAPRAKNLLEAVSTRLDQEAEKKTSHMLAKINHLNVTKTDAFVEALLSNRRDLAGLPFALGDACRTGSERSKQFKLAVATIRSSLQQVEGTATPQTFWNTYHAITAQEDRTPSHNQDILRVQATMARVAALEEILDKSQREHVARARVAALMQILAPESPAMRVGLVKYLSRVAHVEATKALARLAIFSAEEEVRQAAIDALKVRRERDYTDILLQGMRYPFPAVAKRAGEALIKLKRKDLVPQLVDLLEEADPRAPVVQEAGEKKTTVVRELVRVNHHRNCIMCHAPGNTGNVSPEALTARIPLPNEPLTPPSQGYMKSVPDDILVRIDVTYLRQDFSMFQAVADANPWPEMQRFDFLVRTREVNEEEAATYRKAFEQREPGEVSPYQRAALHALRELTGKDAAPTPEAWRKLLKLDAKERARPASME
jgi:hypothetical protein